MRESVAVGAWLAVVGEALAHALRWRMPEAPAGSSELTDYLMLTQGHARAERLRALFMDGERRVLGDVILAEGDRESVPVSIREILDRAFAVDAQAMVLVHNHPSGDPKPSRADIELTRRLEQTGRECGVMLLDHIIVARGASRSLRSMGLL